MKSKILITVGGTGGHVFPAMALAKQLKAADPSLSILFVGGKLNSNRYFDKIIFPFQEVHCGSISPLKPIASLWNLGKILKGFNQSRRLIREFSPDLIVGFGSYYTLPTLLAAKFQKVPIVLHEANRIPGRVNRWLSPYATVTGIHFPDTSYLLKGKSAHATIPLREGYLKGSTSKDSAKAYYKLNPALKTVLIFGGSQGAQAINKMAASALFQLSDQLKKQLQVLHFTGDSRATQQLTNSYREKGIKAVIADFEPRMDLAWQASDLMISRAGAGTLAEQLEFEVPGILIPYPHATDNHQENNADYMVDVIGGAVKLVERQTDANQLSTVLSDLLTDDGYKIQAMQEAIQSYKNSNPSTGLRELILNMLK